MARYQFTPRGVCSMNILFDVDDNIVRNVKFVGGCNGNTQGVAALAEGMEIHELIRRLKGINCNGKGTSCPDQLARALEQAL